MRKNRELLAKVSPNLVKSGRRGEVLSEIGELNVICTPLQTFFYLHNVSTPGFLSLPLIYTLSVLHLNTLLNSVYSCPTRCLKKQEGPTGGQTQNSAIRMCVCVCNVPSYSFIYYTIIVSLSALMGTAPSIPLYNY